MKRNLKIDENGKSQLQIVPSWYDYLFMLVYCVVVYTAVLVGIFSPEYTGMAIFIALITFAIAVVALIVGEIRSSAWKKHFRKEFSERSEKLDK